MNDYCDKNWSEVIHENIARHVYFVYSLCIFLFVVSRQISHIPVQNETLLLQYCFNAHYIHQLLTDGYKFDSSSWSNIHFQPKVWKYLYISR